MSTIAPSANRRYTDYLEREPVSRPARSTPAIWGGRVLTAVPVLFLLFDAVSKLRAIPAVTETFVQLGWPVSLAKGIGVHTLFPVYIGLLVWGALFLRDERVRALIPVRR